MNRVSTLCVLGGAEQTHGGCETRVEQELAGRKQQA
jgi:hypothetical protein